MLTFAKKPLHLLMADDDDEDRLIFTEAIKSVAPSVILECAINCEAVLDKLENSHTLPDVIFLDLNMPIMGGLECLKKIKASKRLLQIPVIIYSTSSSEKDIQNTFDSGATYYIIKPSLNNELEALL